MKVYLGVDCGATNLRIGLIDETGKLISSSEKNSPLKEQPDSFARVVRQQVARMKTINPEEVAALGVGIPGPLELGKGLLLPSSNLGNSRPIDLKNQFTAAFSQPTFFDRDTNLSLMGEAWQGVAVSKQDVVMLTLGSGVGGALMINGEIERGTSGKAGEIGHMIISVAGPAMRLLPVCGLGHEGCLEAFLNSAKSLEEFATYLGYGLANIVDIFNPEMIVIGGGKVNLGNFLPEAVGVMKALGTKGAVDEVEISYAKLGELSGVYGGAKLAMSGQ